MRIRPIRNIEGHEELCEEFFENVRIPKGNLVGGLNQGWPIAKTLLGFERLNHGSPRRAQYPLQKLEIVARQRGVWNDAVDRVFASDVDDLAAFRVMLSCVPANLGPIPPMGDQTFNAGGC